MTVQRQCIGAVACLTLLAAAAFAQEPAPVRSSRITYLTSVSAYIAAGREEGLREGAAVQVIRSGAVVGVLKVTFLASHESACDIVSQSAALVVGDTVRFRLPATGDSTDARQASAPVAPAAGTVRTPAGSQGTRGTLRGRIGTHYLAVEQAGSGGFTQPSLDVRLDGRPAPNGAFGVAVDVRARRTASTNAGVTVLDGRARAYQLAVFWNPPGSPGRLTLGRQLVPGASLIGLFDGLLAEVIKPRWDVGVFAGTQPDPLNLGFAADIQELGGYVQRRSQPGARRFWSATLGVSGSYQNAHANREFAFLQWSFSSERFSALLSQEVDYYRPWKRTQGTPAISPTSTFATARYGVSRRLELYAGLDSRRNVFLYRDAVDPVTTFDDTFRQGVWAGARARLTSRVWLDVDARQSSGGTVGPANSYTWSANATRLIPLATSVRARSTYFRSRDVDGWLHSIAFGFDRGTWLHVDVSGGARLEHDALATLPSQSTRWWGLDLDAGLTRSWYFILSTTAEHGGDQPMTQVFGGLSVRF